METNELHKEYIQMVEDLSKPGETILRTLTPEKCHLNHMACGVAGEAGELLDEIKKHINYNRSLDMFKVIKELGDIEFYLQGVRNALGIKRDDVLKLNMQKLRDGENARYSSGSYSDDQAINRTDTQTK